MKFFQRSTQLSATVPGAAPYILVSTAGLAVVQFFAVVVTLVAVVAFVVLEAFPPDTFHGAAVVATGAAVVTT